MTAAAIDTDLDQARRALAATIHAARKATRGRRNIDLVAEEVLIPSGYAKEWRLILGALAARQHVFAVGTTGENGSYIRGYAVTLYGFKSDVRAVLAAYQAARETADTEFEPSAILPGEDKGTYRSSWLLGFRLAIAATGPKSDHRAPLGRGEVEATVRARIPAGQRGVAMRSTGSGAWAGYTARLLADGHPAWSDLSQDQAAVQHDVA
jgi:hypothetical protein